MPAEEVNFVFGDEKICGVEIGIIFAHGGKFFGRDDLFAGEGEIPVGVGQVQRPCSAVGELVGKFQHVGCVGQSLHAERVRQFQTSRAYQIRSLFVRRQDSFFVDVPAAQSTVPRRAEIVADCQQGKCGESVGRRFFLQKFLQLFRRNFFRRETLHVERLKDSSVLQHLHEEIFLRRLRVAEGKSFSRQDLSTA